MIIRVRRRLLAAVREYETDGTTPPGVDTPKAYRRRGVQLTLAEGANWLEATDAMVAQVVNA
jgi:hypothetical protein